MSDLRSHLERIGDRAGPAPDALARLERSRRRRERNRRVVAAVVAFVVAVGGTVAVFTAFRGGDEPIIGNDVPDAFGALWPETTYEDALTVQETVEAGDTSLQWRLDAGETGLAFARDALGWPDPSVGSSDMVDPETARVLVRTPPAPCPSPPVPSCLPRELTVELRQPFGSTGIWSVVSARTDEFIDVPAMGTEIVAGSEFAVSTELPPSTNVYVAWVGIGACSGWERGSIVSGQGTVPLTAPALPDGHAEGCEVALVVMNNDPADHGIEGLGEQLLRYGYRTTLYGVLAVPVLLVPETVDPSVPDVANVTCDGATVVSDTSVVRAQADGVHLVLETMGGTSFVITEDPGPEGFTDPDTPIGSGEGQGALPSGPVVVEVPPGRYLVSCSATPDEGTTAGIVGTAPLEVVDPAGHYIPFEPECLGDAYGMAPGYPAGGAQGDRGDPIDVARSRLTGLEEGDVVERAGYPESAAEPVIRIVRDGAVVGSVFLSDDGEGGWLLSSLEGCGGTAFGWSEGSREPGDDAAVDCESGNIEVSVVPLEFMLVVEDFEFDLSCVRVPAREHFTITLDNRDAGVPHNISIYPEGSDRAAFVGDLCVGVGTFTYEVPALEAGTYRFVDDTHPATAEGVLIVGDPDLGSG